MIATWTSASRSPERLPDDFSEPGLWQDPCLDLLGGAAWYGRRRGWYEAEHRDFGVPFPRR